MKRNVPLTRRLPLGRLKRQVLCLKQQHARHRYCVRPAGHAGECDFVTPRVMKVTAQKSATASSRVSARKLHHYERELNK
jgi:hypothetical protein